MDGGYYFYSCSWSSRKAFKRSMRRDGRSHAEIARAWQVLMRARGEKP